MEFSGLYLYMLYKRDAVEDDIMMVFWMLLWGQQINVI